MSKECLSACPRIINAENQVKSNWIVTSAFYIDKDTDRLMSACEASYDCPGPIVTPVEVVKGLFKKRVEIEQQSVCSLE